MWDPDAPSPEDPKCRSWLHWIYVDAVGKHLTGGSTITAYNGPTPPMGTHNYHIGLYRQTQGSMAGVSSPSSRCKFNPGAFAQEYGLHLVAEVTYKVTA